MYRLLICCVLAFIQLHTQCHAQTAYLQTERVYEGDIAELIIEYDSKIPSLYAIDTSALELHFEVLEIKSQLSRVLESKEMFHRMQWRIAILPRHSGLIVIPALQIGDVSTSALTLEVAPQTPELRSMQNVFVEIEAQPKNPYVGQLAHIVMRLLHNIPLSDYILLEAATENAEVYRIGKDSRYVTTRDNKTLNVLERRVALVIQEPGEISLSPASYRGFTGSAQDASNTDLTARSRRINRSSEVMQLQVRKPPSEFNGEFWLPARHLEVSQRWDETPGELNVGDSLGFTLTIESRGLPASALPAGLITVDSEQFKIYADQEVRSNRYQDNDLVGRLDQRFAVVVLQPGEIDIPATFLQWWDVTQDIERVARLEGKKLLALSPAVAQSDHQSMRNQWPWFVLISLVLLVCGLAFCFKPARDRVIRKLGAMTATRRNRRALKRACMSNNPARTRRELLQWGRQQWSDDNINGLHQIGSRTQSGAMVRELLRLDAVLYANHSSAWQGQALWRLIAAERKYRSAGSELHENSLPDLYPQQNLSVQAITR